MKNTIVLPAMSKEEYDELPGIVRRFMTWQRARQPLTVKPVRPPQKVTRYAMYSRIARKDGGR